jgi:hypothetical protein
MRARLGAVGGVLVSAIALAGASPAAAQFVGPDCLESGGGQIVAANGDDATFGGSSATDRVASNQVYIDHGPATGFSFHSITQAAMLCDLDARRAEITGTGQVRTQLGPPQIVGYRIAIFAPNNRAGSPDFYRITLTNGYDSGEQPVDHGNINLRAR